MLIRKEVLRDPAAKSLSFTAKQLEELNELLSDKYASLWSQILIGVGTGPDKLVTIALSQIGNRGGEKYWRWAGSSKRIPWCALFVSWCGEQAGLRSAGTPRNRQSTVKALQLSDFYKLFSKIDSYPDPRAVLMIYLLSSTGMREGEAAGLKWQDCDFENRLIRIEREAVYIPKIGLRITSPKSATSTREICIPDLLCEKMRAYKAIQEKEIEKRCGLYKDEGYILTQYDGSPIHASTFREWTKKVFDFCEVPYVTVHGLRHTYASLLISNGTDPRTAAAQLGHSTPSLTMNIYANPQNSAKRKAGDLMGRIIEGEYQ